MKFVVKSSELVKELRKAIKGYDPKEESSFILFDISQNDKLVITARSRSAYFEGNVATTNVEKSDEDGDKFYINGTTLRQLTGIFPSAPIDVTFEFNERTREFKITYSGSQFKLGIMENFTEPQRPETVDLVSIPAVELMSAYRDLLKITNTSSEGQNHQSSCIDMKFEEGVLTLMATDSFAFGEIKLNYDDSEFDEVKQYLVRHTEVATLMGAFDANEMLTITTSRGMIGYYDEDGSLALVGQAALTPLDYKPILQMANGENKVLVDKGEFRFALDTIAKVTENNIVTLEVEKGSHSLKVSNMLGNKIEVNILDMEVAEDFKQDIAIHVMLESLAPAYSDKIRFEWGDISQAPLIRTSLILDDGSVDDNVNIVSVLYVQADESE